MATTFTIASMMFSPMVFETSSPKSISSLSPQYSGSPKYVPESPKSISSLSPQYSGSPIYVQRYSPAYSPESPKYVPESPIYVQRFHQHTHPKVQNGIQEIPRINKQEKNRI